LSTQIVELETNVPVLACIKAWVNEHAYNGEYTDILITMTRKWNCYAVF